MFGPVCDARAQDSIFKKRDGTDRMFLQKSCSDQNTSCTATNYEKIFQPRLRIATFTGLAGCSPKVNQLALRSNAIPSPLQARCSGGARIQ